MRGSLFLLCRSGNGARFLNRSTGWLMVLRERLGGSQIPWLVFEFLIAGLLCKILKTLLLPKFFGNH